MKHLSRNYLMGVLILTLAVVLLFGCATKSKTTQPEGRAEQTKPASESTAKSPEMTPSPSSQPQPQLPSQPSSPPSNTPEVTQAPAQRTTEIVLASVNLRKEPSMKAKIIRVLKKGTKLIVLEEKTDWLRVRLEDGAAGWVGKLTTAEGTRPGNP